MPAPLAMLLACLLMPAPVAADPPPDDVHALIAKVLRSYGGREALDKIHAYRVEGTLFNMRRHDESPTVRIFARPGRLKVLLGYEGASEVRIVDGARGWRNQPGESIEPAAGPMLDAMTLQAARAGVPWILAERESVARLVNPQDGSTVADVRSSRTIEIPLGEGLTFRAAIDPETFRVSMSEGLIDRGGFKTHFETYYSDFHTVNGLRFAQKEENWASGVQTGITTIRIVLLNPKIQPHEFEPPKTPGGKSSDS
jgi:hypothetical protein